MARLRQTLQQSSGKQLPADANPPNGGSMKSAKSKKATGKAAMKVSVNMAKRVRANRTQSS